VEWGLNDKWVRSRARPPWRICAERPRILSRAGRRLYDFATRTTVGDGPHESQSIYLWTGTVDPNGTAAAGHRHANPKRAPDDVPRATRGRCISCGLYQEKTITTTTRRLVQAIRDATPGTPLYDRGMAIVPDLVSAFKATSKQTSSPRCRGLWPRRVERAPGVRSVRGAALTSQLLDVLAASPEVWAKTYSY